MVVTALIMGAVLAAGLVALAATVELHRERAFYAAMLMAIAFFYPVFAAERLALVEAFQHAGLAMAFVFVALGGYRYGGGLIALGLLAHGVFDSAGLVFGFHAPAFWAEACLGFDVVLAVAARVFIARQPPAP